MATVTTDHPAGLSIQEVARRTGFSESTLRYYERIGLIDPVPRAKIQKMPPGLDYDRSCTGLLQRGMTDDEVLALDDVTAWTGDVQKLRPRFQAVLLPADIAIRPMIIRRRTDFYRTITGLLLPGRDGHSYPPFIAGDVQGEDDAQDVGLSSLNPSALQSSSISPRYPLRAQLSDYRIRLCAASPAAPRPSALSRSLRTMS